MTAGLRAYFRTAWQRVRPAVAYVWRALGFAAVRRGIARLPAHFFLALRPVLPAVACVGLRFALRRLRAERSRLPKRTRLIWGPVPLISNKYWSRAMREAGWDSESLMTDHYPQHVRSDYDVYYDDIVPAWVPVSYRFTLGPYFAFLHVVRHACVLHISYMGGPLASTPLRHREAEMLEREGVKTVVLPYGGDGWLYSRIIDPSLRNALLINYPGAARIEPDIAARVAYWNRYADIVITMLQIDGMGRWDVTTPSAVCVDVRDIAPKSGYSSADGMSGPVSVIHTPNHRGVKGTEFLVHAVEELRAEGLKVELRLVEGVPNSEIKAMLQSSDILAEHFIGSMYGLSGIEGMACGLPVMGNFESETYTRLFRRYAFLDECPVLSTSPETLKRNLRVLVRNPELREVLGRAGRKYVEKYHSYSTAQYLFGSVYRKILEGEPIDLMNLFHPLSSEFNRRSPKVEHPLVENRLPAGYLP